MDKINSPAKDGRYEIAVTDTEVFLSVWPPANGGNPVSKTNIIKELNDRNLVDFDRMFVFQVIKEALGTPTLIMNSLPKKDGRYEITMTDTEVFLTVWSPRNGGKSVTKKQIIEDLTDKQLNDFDENFIYSIIKEATGQPSFIINLKTKIPEATIRVRVSSNRLEAMVDISVPAAAPAVTVTQLIEHLKNAGVVYGIDKVVLETLSKSRLAKNIVCAQGIPPREGDTAYLKYHVDVECQGRPEEQEDGRVDFKETNTFLCVEKGALLVEKIPATIGVSGIDVFGKEILPKAGKDVAMPLGKNVVCLDNLKLYAAIDGHLHVFLKKRINVIPVIVIEGDVDFNTGNIDFKGSVTVKGSIQPDFSVKAGGNVEVCGSICGGTVEANNIIVRNGIQGMNRGVVKARERLVANFINNATVYSDADIVVEDFIMNSNVFAGSRVILEGGRGLIRGGRISAGELIRAVTVGNRSGIITELEVSVNPFLKDELVALRESVGTDVKLYEKLKLSLDYARRLGVEKLAGVKLERYKKEEEEFNNLPERIEENKQRIVDIEGLLNSKKPGRVRIAESIYPGTRIAIGTVNKVLKDEMKYVSFYAQAGEIKFNTLH
ncbi:DUF342 domain-containing protein [Anaerosinus massiliensis]|uniref:DUF342 domain-containing protein n=1 Tax=Massilibacillus massiliensis TaxID=1806837 RepID=UPI000A603028|nr:FapA family protein [Massilibacillus massiliensis]